MKWVHLALAAAVAGAGAVSYAALSGPSTASAAEAAAPAYWVEDVAQTLNMPWSMAWLPNGTLLIVEKYGGIRIYRNGKLEEKPLGGVPAAFQYGQNGLLDLELDPDFKTNQRIFLTFTEGTADNNRGAVYRAKLVGDTLVDGQVIYRTTPDSHVFPYPLAGRLLFLPDKTFLLTSTDDHSHRHLAQLLDNDVSKILRLDRDGKAPKDNPFVGTPKARPEVYAYGVRAPMDLLRDPRDGKIWEVENGPKGGDELNVLKPGANYGWPIVGFGTEYTGENYTDKQTAPGVETAVVQWTPSIAPSSMTLYLGKSYPQWHGDFFVGALIQQHLRRVRIVGGKAVEQEVMLKDLKERIRDVRTGPDGLLYILTDNPNGRLLRLVPGAPKPAQEAKVAKPLTTPGVNLMAGFPKPLKPDPANGQKLFGQRCIACHAVEGPGDGRPGPSLTGIVGRKIATAPGFAYSAAMKRSTIVWTNQYLDDFMSNPQDYIPGTAMAAPPVTDRQQRTDIIAYLNQVQGKGQGAAPVAAAH